MFQACFQPQMKFRWRPHCIQVMELDGKQTNEPKLGALGVLGGEKNDLMQLPCRLDSVSISIVGSLR